MLENTFSQLKKWTARILFAVLTAAITFIPIAFLAGAAFISTDSHSCGLLPFSGAIGFGGLAGIFTGTLSLIFGPPWTWHEPFAPVSQDKAKLQNLQDEH